MSQKPDWRIGYEWHGKWYAADGPSGLSRKNNPIYSLVELVGLTSKCSRVCVEYRCNGTLKMFLGRYKQAIAWAEEVTNA